MAEIEKPRTAIVTGAGKRVGAGEAAGDEAQLGRFRFY